MSARRFWRSLIAPRWSLAALIFLAALPPAITALAQCLGPLYTQIICSKAPGNDGKRLVKLSFEDSDNLNVYTALRSAVDDWNRFSDTTGVVFEIAELGATNGDIHVRFSANPAATQGCVAYQPDHAGIYWGVEFQSRGNNSSLGQTQLTSVFIHELGHTLGLDHYPPGTQPATIMNQTPDCHTATEVNSATQSDAQQAASCLAANCPPTPAPTPVRSGGGIRTGGRTCGYQESVEPTYNAEGDVTGSQVVYTWMCN